MYKQYENKNTSRSRRRKASGKRGFPIFAAILTALAAGFILGTAAANARGEKEVSLPLLPLTPVFSASPESPSGTGKPEGIESSVMDASAAVLPLEDDPGITPSPSEDGGGYPLTVRLKAPSLTVSLDGEPVVMLLEDYLIGVVAAEMSADSEPEALKAQAVAARTFTALHMAGSAVCKSGCTVCSDHRCCQAYMTDAELRAAWGNAYERNIERIRAAVRDTEGLVAVYDGKLISALYHASSGPMTENSEAVFAVAKPYLVSVESFEGDNEVVSVREFPMEELVEKLNGEFPLAELKTPMGQSDLDIWGRSESGRVNLMRVGNTVISGQLLRQALGLKSTAFTVEIGESTVTITCTGYGHGVGMSQLGANEMAKNGATFAEILAHFYSGTELAKLTFGEE